MGKATFELEWDDNLGEGWMNVFNLELCLCSSEHTRRGLVRVREVKASLLKRWWSYLR